MGSSAATSPASSTPAQLAKAALRRLAEQRLEPTPEHYRKAYEAEAGLSEAPAAAPPEAPALTAAEDGERWSTLIGRIVKGAERGGRQWTSARKKDSLQRVLEGSRGSVHRLHQRLGQLVNSWDNDTLDDSLDVVQSADEGVPASPAPASLSPTDALPLASAQDQPVAPGADKPWPALAEHGVHELEQSLQAALPADDAQAGEAREEVHQALDRARRAADEAAQALARDELSQACAQARRLIEHRYQLIDQLSALCHTLTDSMADMAEDDSWAQGQCQAMRHQLEDGLHPRGVRHMLDLMETTRQRHKQLKQDRESARQALKQLIHQMLQEIGELGSTTDRFQHSLGRYADTIGQADSLESLAGVVREMVEESRAVQHVVAQTQTRMQAEHQRATELTDRVRSLEDEIRKLSDEVSTDPLTQIANRRGLMREFDKESARMERSGGTLAIGLLDVDNFKKLNDQMGHQTGDLALQFLARRVGECLRPSDSLARYGGEEFVVLLPDTAVDEAQQVLTRLQRTLSAEFFTQGERKVFITFSAGVTQYRAGEAIEAALDRADVALYEAKRNGKNRTCIG